VVVMMVVMMMMMVAHHHVAAAHFGSGACSRIAAGQTAAGSRGAGLAGVLSERGNGKREQAGERKNN
jgi:hypothetical protein